MIRRDGPCSDADCRQRFQSPRAAAEHYRRQHRWSGSRQVLADGGETVVDRRYVCRSCDGVVRARYFGGGSFAVGCECTTVPVVPQMEQAETPENWRVEREECCRGVDVSDLEVVYGDMGEDYRCPDCGATYGWDGEMARPPAESGQEAER